MALSLTLTLLLAFAALSIEAAFGYPSRLLRAIGHPVMWMGALIGALDRFCNRGADGFARRRAAGVVALVVVLAVFGLPALALQLWLGASVAGFVLLAVLAASLPAQRSLHQFVGDVAQALEDGDFAGGRAAVAHIVGRDPRQLDASEVSRAAIESLAESFCDGVAAPAFWLALGGLPGGVAYKAINTADSMIGHKSPRHLAFGWAGARLDDVANWPAARLSGGLIVLAAALLPGASGARAWRVMRADAGKHRSPNAGWPEAAMAGALGLRLGGPRSYEGVRIDVPVMGEGGRESLDAHDIRRALQLYRLADGLMLALIGFAALVCWLA